MRENEIKNNIVSLLEKHPVKVYTAEDIARDVNLSVKSRSILTRVLKRMVVDGDIVSIRRGAYALGDKADLISGALRALRGGKAIVSCSKSDVTVFIPKGELKTAMPGDRVLVRIDPESSRERPQGRIVRVIERAQRDIVGTLKRAGKFLCVVPMNPAYRQDIYVANDGGAAMGDRVVVRFTGWANEHVSPEGDIVDVIGAADKPGLDTEVTVRQFDLPGEFPHPVMLEAETVSARLDRPGKREDLRDKLIVTIDPVNARDFDDALSLEYNSEKQRVLGIHIADVSHYVRHRSALDAEALKRGNSVYLVDKVIPMLPEQLSNGVCSLRPDEDRLAFSAFLTLSSRGTIVGRRFVKTRIRSKSRMTYEQALSVIEGDSRGQSRDVARLVRDLHKLAQQLRRRRFSRHALELETAEAQIILDSEQRMTGVRVSENDVSHQLVEECMVAANEAVATEFGERGIPIITRLHERPDEEKLADLTADLKLLGLAPGDLNQPRHMADFLRLMMTHPLGEHVTTPVLRSLKRAVYSAGKGGHYGLAKRYYAHFTSPIRRYSDLVLHRQLSRLATQQSGARMDKAYLNGVAQQCTEREMLADDAERSLKEIKKFRYLQEMVEKGKAEEYDAVIVSVMNFGMFVDVHELQVGGLVHVSTMSKRFVRYSAGKRSLRDGRQEFTIGKKVRVSPCKVDFDSRKLDFVLV